MKLYDVEEEAQAELHTESKEITGKVIKKNTMSWDTFKEEKSKKGLDKITVWILLFINNKRRYSDINTSKNRIYGEMIHGHRSNNNWNN